MEVKHQTEAQAGRLSDLVQQVSDTIRRRWLTLTLVTAVVFAACVAGVFMLKPRYTATALIKIDPSRNPLAKGPETTRGELNPEAIETEVAVIRSMDLARNVVRDKKLDQDPQLTSAIKDYGSMTPAERQGAVARVVLDRLDVNRDKLTYLIAIHYTSPDPNQAATVANAFAEGYLASKLSGSVGTASRQADWFRAQLEELAEEVRVADAKVAQYRAAAGLVPGTSSGGTIADQQVAALSSQLASAESEAAAARSAYAAAQGQIARGGLDSVAEVRSSPVISDLRRQRAEVLRSMGEVEARYGPRHPESIRVRDQLGAIDAQIRDEAQRAISSLRASASAADARAASLRGSMGRLEAQRGSNTRAAVMADSLERDAAAKRAAYERMSQQFLESNQAAQNRISQAVIAESAQAPSTPSFPRKGLMIALSLIVALAVAIGVVIVQEMLVRGMRTLADAEEATGLPVLAAVPKVRGGRPGEIIIDKPTSLFAEAFRIARTAVLGVRSGTPPKVIALTSALPGEGKTTSAIAFARTLAMNNARTILVEGDVRRAQVRANIDNPPDGPGIVEYLRGEVSADEVISSGGIENLDMMIVRAPYYSPENLFETGRMRELIAELSTRYDHVVMDLPPLVGLADGRILAAMADVVMVVVRWADTPTQAVASAVNWLRADGSNPIGVVYTMVDTQAEAIGGLYYSKKYAAYYRAAA
jgi:capsular exopolysaccharide synthesis family protein